MTQKKREPEADECRQTISRIDDEEQKYHQKEELAGKRKELEELDQRVGTEETELKEYEKSLTEKIDALKKTVKELKDKPTELAGAQNEGEKLAALLADLGVVFDDRIPKREKRKKELTRKQKVFLEARGKYDEAVGRREEAERILEDSRAGILAKKLVEGEKCPVCGSVHHPEPAKLQESSVSEEDSKTAGGRDRASGEKEYGKYGSGKGQDIAGGMRGTAQNSDAGLRGKPASGHGDGGSVTRGTDQGSRGGKNAGRNHVRRKS